MADEQVPCPWCDTPITRPTSGFVICHGCWMRWDWDYDWLAQALLRLYEERERLVRVLRRRMEAYRD